MRLPVPEEYFKNMSSEEAKSIIFSHGAQAIDFNNLRETIEHPQTQEVHVLKEMDHPVLGRHRVVTNSWRGPWEDPTLSPSPSLGQHTAEFA